LSIPRKYPLPYLARGPQGERAVGLPMTKICILEANLEPGIDALNSGFPTQALKSYPVVNFGRCEIIVRHKEHDAVFPLFQQRVLTDTPDKAFRATPAAIEWVGVNFGDGGHVLALAFGCHDGADVRRSAVIQLMDPEQSIFN